MKYTYPDKILQIFELGQQTAERLKHNAIAPEHVIVSIASDPINRARTCMVHFGVNIDLLEMRAVFFLHNRYAEYAALEDQEALEITLSSQTEDQPDHTYRVTKDMDRLMRVAELEARMMQNSELGPEHIFLAMLKESSSSLSKILMMYRVDYKNFKEYLSNMSDTPADDGGVLGTSADGTPLRSTPLAPLSSEDLLREVGRELNKHVDDDEDDEDDEEDEDSKRDIDNGDFDSEGSEENPFMSRPQVEVKTTSTVGGGESPLSRFGYDLTQAAEEGLLDPCVGREEEIEHMIQALLRRKKNNPILIGEPGVGKTAVVEGLAQRIARRDVCWALQNKRIVSLDMASVVAGTKFRGQFEKRMKLIVDELRQNKDIIVYIDEIHSLVGAGASSGALDAANILKPALSRGEFQCIGSTTFDEYRNSIEKDGALERRFQKVTINPTSAEDTLTILRNLKERYEQYHHVTYTDQALESCVQLTDRYISDRNFPDKAIDAMDEAGAHAHVKDDNFPTEIIEMENQLHEATKMKRQMIDKEQYEDAALYHETERKLENRIKEKRAEWEQVRSNQPPKEIGVDEVTQVIASISGVPVEKAAASESERLLSLRADLDHAIIGQETAVAKIVRAIQRNRVGLNDPNRPIGSFLFVGPTGVGKTLLARTLAKEMFLSESSYIRLDMSEFSEQHSVARIIGAPPGYLGHEKGGQLAEHVRHHPYSVVLFDEIEKAHPNIYNVLLQILDDGQMTDGLGRKVNFKNTIIIMTSNVGSRRLKEFGTGIGFNNHSADHLKQQAEGLIRKEIQKTFSPEFLNRIDDIVLFEHLEMEDIRRIVDLELDKALKRVRELGYQIEVDTASRDFLATNGYDRDLGARPLRRAIQTYIEDELCDTLLEINKSGEDKKLYAITVTMPEEAAPGETDSTSETKTERKPVIAFHKVEQIAD
jgi:ATP-dependent Clp protease ATP-binding subunit ClpC